MPSRSRSALPGDAAVFGPASGVTTRSVDRYGRAHDASHYLLVPRAVVTPRSAEDVAEVFRGARAARRAVVFRSGGTSLSGQSVTDDVLVDTRSGFRRISVADDGGTVTAEPGATVRAVNARLLRRRRKLGPDPASEIACTIGGVVANNSSGMSCGVDQNTYRTIDSMRLVLPSGTIIDTADPDAEQHLRTGEPRLHRGLLQLREDLLADPVAVAEVQRLFRMKNTMGYSINALVDHSGAVDILTHLVVGSEGTLAFVAEATFRTVEVLPAAATALLVFSSLQAATAALPALVATGLAAIELMDATALRVAQRAAGTPQSIANLEIKEHTALLVEFQAASDDDLDVLMRIHQDVSASARLAAPQRFTTDPAERAALWRIRKGLYASVAGERPSGTTALLEDVVVPVDRLRATCEGLTALFDEHGYHDAVIFGHAKDGNLHFMLVEDFRAGSSLQRYQRFTADLVDLILSQGGSLKAEHGTGRAMAPFVRRQYGDFLYGVMERIKDLFDPAGILNPGVILDDDPEAYLRNLKTSPSVEAEVDRCVECGYCEPACPSKDLTLTPRQRIVLRREAASAHMRGDSELAHELSDGASYEIEQTCAVDGMCATACPVDINTGDLVRRLRSESVGAVDRLAWNLAAQHWGPATRAGGKALTLAHTLPTPLVTSVTAVGRRLLGADTVPSYGSDLPRGGAARPSRLRGVAPGAGEAVFFAACVGTVFGPTAASGGSAGSGSAAAFLRLAETAGVPLVIPRGLDSLCCGTPWKSKGHLAGHRHMVDLVLPALREASDDGRLPIVCDASSCTEGLLALADEEATRAPSAPLLRVVDATVFTAERLLPALPPVRRAQSLVVHRTCSMTSPTAVAALLTLADAVATTVVQPDDWGCCAFAGDRGMLHPELTAAATRAEAHELSTIMADDYVSSNRTCELGMTRATGRPYRHILEVLEERIR